MMWVATRLRHWIKTCTVLVVGIRFAHTERRVRAFAARVGRAMVFAFHKNAQGEAVAELLKTIRTYVASELP